MKRSGQFFQRSLGIGEELTPAVIGPENQTSGLVPLDFRLPPLCQRLPCRADQHRLSAADLALEQLSNDDLHAAIRDLTDEQQQVLILRFFQDLTANQVAGIMGKSVGAVQALQHRALGSLERALQGRAAS